MSMTRGICRNCGAHAVFKKQAYSDYSIPVRAFSVTTVHHFVCARCGYTENYVLDGKKLQQIANNWDYVDPRLPFEGYPGDKTKR